MYKIIKILIVITTFRLCNYIYKSIASAEEDSNGTRLNNVVNFVLDYLLIMHL